MISIKEFTEFFDNGQFDEFHQAYPDFDFNQKTDPNMPGSKTFFQSYALRSNYDEDKKSALDFMLKFGADINFPLTVAGHESSLLMSCLISQNILLAHYLINKDADLFAPYADATVIHYIVQQPGNNYLYEAVEKSFERSQIDPSNIIDSFGNNPLMVAVKSSNHKDSNIYTSLLINKTKDLTISNVNNENVFHLISGLKHNQNLNIERLVVNILKTHPETLKNLLSQDSKQFHHPLDFARKANASALISLILNGGTEGSNSHVYSMGRPGDPQTAIENLCQLNDQMLEKICVDINKIHVDAFNKPLIPLKLISKNAVGIENLEFHIPTAENLAYEKVRTSLNKEDEVKKEPKKQDMQKMLEQLGSMVSFKEKNVKLFEYILDIALSNKLKLTDNALYFASRNYLEYPQVSKKLIDLGLNPNVIISDNVKAQSVPVSLFFGNVEAFTEKNKDYSQVKKILDEYLRLGFKWHVEQKENDQEPYNFYFNFSKVDVNTLKALEHEGCPMPSTVLFDLIKSKGIDESNADSVLGFFKGKVDFNLKNKLGFTVLEMLAKEPNIKQAICLTNALIKNGSDPQSDPDFNPLSACFLFRNRDLAQRWSSTLDPSIALVGALMFDGADKKEDAKLTQIKSICEVIEDFSPNYFYGVDEQGASPLMASVYLNNEKAVESLLAIGVDPKKVPSIDNDGIAYTVLDMAIEQDVDIKIIDMLKKVHAPSNLHEQDYQGEPELPKRKHSASELFDKALKESREAGMKFIPKADSASTASQKTTKTAKP